MTGRAKTRVEVRFEAGDIERAQVYLDDRRVGTAPYATMRDGTVYVGSPTCETYADALALEAAIKAGESGGWSPPNVLFDPADPAAQTLEQRNAIRGATGRSRARFEFSTDGGATWKASTVAAHPETERRRERNQRKAARRARRGKASKPRGTRQRIAGLCRRLDREERSV